MLFFLHQLDVWRRESYMLRLRKMDMVQSLNQMFSSKCFKDFSAEEEKQKLSLVITALISKMQNAN